MYNVAVGQWSCYRWAAAMKTTESSLIVSRVEHTLDSTLKSSRLNFSVWYYGWHKVQYKLKVVVPASDRGVPYWRRLVWGCRGHLGAPGSLSSWVTVLPDMRDIKNTFCRQVVCATLHKGIAASALLLQFGKLPVYATFSLNSTRSVLSPISLNSNKAWVVKFYV